MSKKPQLTLIQGGLTTGVRPTDDFSHFAFLGSQDKFEFAPPETYHAYVPPEAEPQKPLDPIDFWGDTIKFDF